VAHQVVRLPPDLLGVEPAGLDERRVGEVTLLWMSVVDISVAPSRISYSRPVTGSLTLMADLVA